MMSVRLPDHLQERLNALSKKTHRPKSYYVVQAIEEYLEEMEDYFSAYEVFGKVASGKEKTYSLESVEKALLDDMGS